MYKIEQCRPFFKICYSVIHLRKMKITPTVLCYGKVNVQTLLLPSIEEEESVTAHLKFNHKKPF